MRNRVIVLLSLGFVILVLLTVSLFYFHQRSDVMERIKVDMMLALHIFEDTVLTNSNVLKLLNDTIVNKSELKRLFKNRERGLLMQQAKPIFKDLSSKQGITHFYFTTVDLINFLRVHQPDRYGDIINRFTIIQAQKTGKPFVGLELGPLGTFTLRMVTPWYDGKELIGYVEIGHEINHLLQKIEEILGVTCIVVINKKFLVREDWQSGMIMLGQEPDWDHFPSFVIMKNIGELSELLHDDPKPFYEGFVASLKFSVAVVDIKDIRERTVASIVLFRDVTEALYSNFLSVVILIFIYLMLFILLFTFFYVFLSKVDIQLVEYQKYLERSKEMSEAQFKAIFDYANDGIIVVDAVTKKFSLCNSKICTMLGYTPEEIIYLSVYDIHPKDELDYVLNQFTKQVNGEVVVVEDIPVLRKDGSVFYADVSSTLIILHDTEYLVGNFRDITDRRRVLKLVNEALKEKEILLIEVHHRVKNNMQIIYSLLDSQLLRVGEDSEYAPLIQANQKRIRSIALVHEILYKSGNFVEIDFEEYIQSLAKEFVNLGFISPILNIHVDKIMLNLDLIIPCGLVMNELLSNCFKYAYPDMSVRPKIEINVTQVNNDVIIVFEDFGVGLPSDFDFTNVSSQGLRLVKSLVTRQLVGHVDLVKKENGTKFHIRFPKNKE